MPAKKAKKIVSTKKLSKNLKQKTVKKSEVKNAKAKKAQGGTKKISTQKKPVAKKINKKIAAKKIQKKPVKKLLKTAKIAKKVTAKKLPKSVAKTKIAKLPPVKIVKKLTPKKSQKAIAQAKFDKALVKQKKKDAVTQSELAKTLLAKNTSREKNISKEKIVEAPKSPERKNEAISRNLIVRRSDGRNKLQFKVGEFVIYPSHGIGKIVGIEKTAILNQELSCYLMYFEKEKLTIKIPVNSAEKIGLRNLVSKSLMDEVFIILRSGIKKLKGMWSRRAQEYETKINSGDIILLAEVLRDLTRDIEDGERSYSERIIYETAIYRLSSEYSAIYGVTFDEAKDKILITAKDKLNSEGRVIQKDEFDDFESDNKEPDQDEEESEEESEDEEDEDEDEDESPRKKRKK